MSPTNRSGGKPSARKNQEEAPPPSPPNFEFDNIGPDTVFNETYENNNCSNDFDMDDRHSEPGDLDDEDDDDDEDDPWKPLNPHEPGNLRVKPFRKVKFSTRQIINTTQKKIDITKVFPVARMHGPISLELTEIWEARHCTSELRKSQFPSFYEQLRDKIIHGAHETCNTFGDPMGGNEGGHVDDDDDDDAGHGGLDFDPPGFDNPEDRYDKYDEVPIHAGEHDGGGAYFNNHEFHGQEDPDSQPNLEDLCRSHLDSLLASIAETEKQTELASRVSTWKQRIEQNLEEQDSRPPFDIHEYGARVMKKLPEVADGVSAMSFTDVVSGLEKHDVARTFSALLQLVNNGNVDLVKDKDDDAICYSGEKPFHVRLLSRDNKKHHEKVGGMGLQSSSSSSSSKKRAAQAHHKGGGFGFGKDKGKKEKPLPRTVVSTNSSSSSSSSLVKIKKIGGGGGGKGGGTPEGKRRRRSRLVEPPPTAAAADLDFAE